METDTPVMVVAMTRVLLMMARMLLRVGRVAKRVVLRASMKTAMVSEAILAMVVRKMMAGKVAGKKPIGKQWRRWQGCPRGQRWR